MNEKWVFGMFKYNIKTIKEISCFWKLNPNFQLVKIKGKHYTGKLGDSAHLCCSPRKKKYWKTNG